MTDPTQRFSSRVTNYVKYRPSYPTAIIDLLTVECGMTPNSIVADVGSGTGLLAELFLKTGKDGQGRIVKKWRLVTEAGYYVTYDEKVKEVARNAIKSASFVEIGFVPDPSEGNLIKSIQKVSDEKAAR